MLAVGTGEYTTGFVGNSESPSDKKLGVVGLVMFDLRRRGLIAPEIKMVGPTVISSPASVIISRRTSRVAIETCRPRSPPTLPLEFGMAMPTRRRLTP